MNQTEFDTLARRMEYKMCDLVAVDGMDVLDAIKFVSKLVYNSYNDVGLASRIRQQMMYNWFVSSTKNKNKRGK